MRHRIAGVILAAFTTTGLLTGCTGQFFPSTTATAAAPTSAALAEQNPDDPMTTISAWQICWAYVYSNLDRDPGENFVPDLAPYVKASRKGKTVTDNGDGTFEVLIYWGKSTDTASAQSRCMVGGTLGTPTLDYQGTMDFH